MADKNKDTTSSKGASMMTAEQMLALEDDAKRQVVALSPVWRRTGQLSVQAPNAKAIRTANLRVTSAMELRQRLMDCGGVDALYVPDERAWNIMVAKACTEDVHAFKVRMEDRGKASWYLTSSGFNLVLLKLGNKSTVLAEFVATVLLPGYFSQVQNDQPEVTAEQEEEHTLDSQLMYALGMVGDFLDAKDFELQPGSASNNEEQPAPQGEEEDEDEEEQGAAGKKRKLGE